MTALPRFVALYAAIYGAYGVASPFLPAFVRERGLSPEEIGLALAAGTCVRLVSAPLAGRIADLVQSLRVMLVVSIGVAALVTLGYLPARGFWMVVAVMMLHAWALAPMTVLADALAIGTRGFEYGRVRGTGSAAFILGTLASGQAIGAFGLAVIVPLQAVLLGAAAFAASRVPEVEHRPRPKAESNAGAGASLRALLRTARYRNLVLLAALVLGSHAMHDAFAVIRWSAAGISAETSSLLWSEAVAAEVLVFWFIGPALVKRLSPAGAMALAAGAGLVRWAVMAQTADVAAVALVQPLHGLTFALFHLACMRVLARTVPPGFEGTAQALYATVGVGAASALLTLASGSLYGSLGPQAFWFMAALCAAALPLTLRLRGG
ncbi:MAG TPA: MFS transporter [Burkholderiales bacterium]|nr:MFS transporter [Burkholderiales bacterium]